MEQMIVNVLLPTNTILLLVTIFRAGRLVQKIVDIDVRLTRIENKCYRSERECDRDNP